MCVTNCSFFTGWHCPRCGFHKEEPKFTEQDFENAVYKVLEMADDSEEIRSHQMMIINLTIKHLRKSLFGHET